MLSFLQFIQEMSPDDDLDHEVIHRAKTEFGTTSNPREAGYILHDGTMLDFTGRHQAVGYHHVNGRNVPKPGQPDYLKNTRNTDHREVADCFPNNIGGHDAMMHMMNKCNAIRYAPGMGMHVPRMPTMKSLQVAVGGHRAIERVHGLHIEIAHPDSCDTLHSKEFKNPNVEKVRSWLESKFKPKKEQD